MKVLILLWIFGALSFIVGLLGLIEGPIPYPSFVGPGFLQTQNALIRNYF